MPNIKYSVEIEMIKNMIEGKIQSAIDEKKALFEEIKAMKPSDIQDDEIYSKLITNPIWEGVKAQTGGLLTLACKIPAVQKKVNVFQTKFSGGMFKVRDDLIVIENEKVSFVDDFQQKLVPTIKAAFV